MLPGFLYSTYKKYKEDTSTFIRWLADTAAQHGYNFTKAPSSESPATAPRVSRSVPRAKAVKRARQQAANGSSTSHPSMGDRSSYIVDCAALLPSAKAIASSDPAVTIPVEIIKAGLRAVSARKRFTAYFQSKTEDGDTKKQEKNERHSYFIDAMEDVLLALQPCFAAAAGADTNGKAPSSSTLEDLQNRFAALDVEDPAEQDDEDNRPPTEGAKDTTPAQPTYDLRVPAVDEARNEEKLFVIFCLCDDLARLRKYLSKLWVEYKLGKIDLLTASMVTNTAFHLASRTQDEAFAAYPEMSDYQDVMNTAILATGTNPETVDGALELEIDDRVADLLFAPVHSLLDGFCEFLVPGKVPMIRRGQFGIYNPKAVRSKMSDAEKIHEDFIVLMELFPEFGMLSRVNIPLFATDELTHGLRKMIETEDIPLWLTFAVTVFMDINHLLRESIDQGFKELQATAKQARETLKKYFKLSKSLPSLATWPSQNQQMLQHFNREIEEGVLKDRIYPFKERHYQIKNKTEISPETEQFHLLRNQPLLCSTMTFRIHLEMQYIGITLCNAWGTAIYPAHLYNALRQKPLPISPWPQIEQLIALHGESRIFIGSRPTTLTDSYKQATLMLGYSASQYAPRRRDARPVASKTGPRDLNDTSMLASFFREGIASDGNMALTVHNVEQLLLQQAKGAALAQDKSVRRAWRATQRLTSFQFLEALRDAIPLELPSLGFDYFLLHERSIALLRRIRKEFDDEFVSRIGKEYIEDETQLPFVGLYVISIACGTEKAAGQLGIEGAGSALLEGAGMVVEEEVVVWNDR